MDFTDGSLAPHLLRMEMLRQAQEIKRAWASKKPTYPLHEDDATPEEFALRQIRALTYLWTRSVGEAQFKRFYMKRARFWFDCYILLAIWPMTWDAIKSLWEFFNG